jgi:hypothetical protein
MTRIDWPVALLWLAVVTLALVFAGVVLTGVLHLAQLVIVALWPWVVANSANLTRGLVIGVVIGAVAATLVEGRR